MISGCFDDITLETDRQEEAERGGHKTQTRDDIVIYYYYYYYYYYSYSYYYYYYYYYY